MSRNNSTKLSDEAILERSKSLCNSAIFTIALQHRRLNSVEPEDDIFIFRRWSDFELMITALQRLRKSAHLMTKVSVLEEPIMAAIQEFDSVLPSLSTMRNIIEHMDEYAIDKGRNSSVSRQQLQVGEINEAIFSWLGKSFNIDEALKAAKKLFQSTKMASANFTPVK